MTGDRAASTTIVVPCFDEADRLDADGLRRAGRPGRRRASTLVDDGSTDGTAGVLADARRRRPGDVHRCTTLASQRRQGRGRAGRAAAPPSTPGPSVVGYYDADLATPPAEMARLVDVLRGDPTLDVVLGSRVALLGTPSTARSPRHYLGRLFATASSLVLGMTVYDTQCGAKVLPRRPGAAGRARPSRSPAAGRSTSSCSAASRGVAGGARAADRRVPRGAAGRVARPSAAASWAGRRAATRRATSSASPRPAPSRTLTPRRRASGVSLEQADGEAGRAVRRASA